MSKGLEPKDMLIMRPIPPLVLPCLGVWRKVYLGGKIKAKVKLLGTETSNVLL